MTMDPELFTHLDDTLDDSTTPTAVPPEARRWLAEQRLVHALLLAAQPRTAARGEATVASVLDRLERPDAAAQPLQLLRGGAGWRRWAVVAAAAALLSILLVRAFAPSEVPTAAAAMQRAVSVLGQDLDHRFQLTVDGIDGGEGRPRLHQEFELVSRPGMRFLVEGKLSFGTFQFGDFRCGCDGAQLWFQPANQLFRRAVPLAEAEKLLALMGNVLDLGYLDVHAFIERLPEQYELEVIGRQDDADGRRLLRIEARARPRDGTSPAADPMPQPGAGWLLFDEDSGMVVQFEFDVGAGHGGRQVVRFVHRGSAASGAVDYRRPW